MDVTNLLNVRRMTSPRHEIYNPSEVGVYHCVSRCVRRAFLCGYDVRSGVSYEHRRTWVRDRLSLLTSVFAVDLIAYAVMMNHMHHLLRNRPDVADSWSAEEVARRWRVLFPRRKGVGVPVTEPSKEEIAEIVNQPELVELYRKRLSNISWFNRCLCEFIARRANREDDCKGRFWEGRFRSQKVRGFNGLLACSTYIDLNPVRAKVATTPEDSDYTSIQDRIRAYRNPGQPTNLSLPKLIPIDEATESLVSLEDYLKLVDETGRALIRGKSSIPQQLAPILDRIKINPNKWLDTTTYQRHRFRRMVAPVECLMETAKKAGKKWLHGIRAAEVAFC